MGVISRIRQLGIVLVPIIFLTGCGTTQFARHRDVLVTRGDVKEPYTPGGNAVLGVDYQTHEPVTLIDRLLVPLVDPPDLTTPLGRSAPTPNVLDIYR